MDCALPKTPEIKETETACRKVPQGGAGEDAMNNGDVLWAWVAGIAVSLVLLFALSNSGKHENTFASNRNLILPDAPLGARQWDLEEWERTGGTPPRTNTRDALHDTFDLLDRVVPDYEFLGTTPAVAEEPAKAW